MMRFFLGLLAGVVLSVLFVRFDISPPAWMQLPGQLRGNIISTAVENELFDLSQTETVRRRALEVFFQNRAPFAVEVDEEAGHPFLNSLYRKRATREARILRHAWAGFDVALKKPALRASLARKHGTNDELLLKQAMLSVQLERKTFLAVWMAKTYGDITSDELLGKIEDLSRLP